MVKYIIILFLFGCTNKFYSTQVSNQFLNGTFSVYHSALGSGNGILFKVRMPVALINHFTIDSFYLNGFPHSFNLLSSERETVLEANYYYVSVGQNVGFGGDEIPKKDPITKNSYDSIFMAHRFYPSWIIASGKLGKQRIDIVEYKQIIAEKKY